MDCKPSDFFMKDPINVHIFEIGKEISVFNKTNKEKRLQFQNLKISLGLLIVAFTAVMYHDKE